MSKVTPTLPKGTRDFGPDELRKRNYIFGIIRNVFEKYGFQPLETPVMENLSTLQGKYGEEGDKLLFRILNSGDFLKDVSQENLNYRQSSKVAHQISEKGLRYDLTIPFARYVVQHQHEITFPFKRYQIQPVWRADRPQKGRYREFYQCDADVIGSDSLLNEVELILIYDEVFRKLGLDVTIKINNRKVLRGIAELLGVARFNDFVIAIDKIDKIGYEEVAKFLEENKIVGEKRASVNFDKGNLSYYRDFFYDKDLTVLISEFKAYDNYEGKEGTEELKFIIDKATSIGKLSSSILFDTYLAPLPLIFDQKLARGLDYYTGTIFEVKANNVQMGSIGGGGRYDNLTGVFGLPGVSGVGISFGVERIYDVMEELKLFDNIDLQSNTTRALFINFGGEAETKAFQYLQQLRANDIPAEIYPSSEKMKKQIGYADKKEIPYAIFVGDEELKSGLVQVKDLKSGEQQFYSIEDVIELLSKKLS